MRNTKIVHSQKLMQEGTRNRISIRPLGMALCSYIHSYNYSYVAIHTPAGGSRGICKHLANIFGQSVLAIAGQILTWHFRGKSVSPQWL